ncbi:MAG: hypothetical protein JWO95_688, partial [Verrucomicrobiales bacterium]|nr:hypothetical protein [Verrucomicrobiales bacterium]
HRVAIFCTEVTAKQTAAIAKSAHIEKVANRNVFRFNLPEAGVAEVTLQ